MVTYATDAEILANRRRVIAFLKKPKRKKGRNFLDKGKGRRCCLGHMCFALGIKKKWLLHGGVYAYGQGLRDPSYAPPELISAVGLHDLGGGWIHRPENIRNYYKKLKDGAKVADICSLTRLNDDTDATPQSIAKYLETVILGGVGTPWIAISVD